MMPSLVLLVAIGTPTLVVLAALWLARYRYKRDGRRSPLTDKLLHGAGQQLRRELEKCDESMDTIMLIAVMSGPLLLVSWALPRLDWANFRLGATEWVLIILFIAAMLWTIPRSIRLMFKRRRLNEGLQGELMTAQLLQPLLGKDCMVFHDIPADGFNLDHVVIGPHGVFMVETKSRKKPINGKRSAHVTYDGKALHFPDHVSTRPLDQARNQARWLKEFLRGAAGENVNVIPVIALPGWFVNYAKEATQAEVTVLNPKMHSTFTDKRNGTPLSDSLRTRIAYALTQRYPAIP